MTLSGDLTPPADMTLPGDLTPPVDMTLPGDLTPPTDFASTDMAVGPPAMAGDSCGTAPTLPIGVLTSGTTIGLADDYDLLSAGCVDKSASEGADGVYAVTIPPNKTLKVVVTPAPGSSFDPVVGLALACAATPTCLTAVDAKPGNVDPSPSAASLYAETVTYKNSSLTTAATVYVLVDSYLSSGAGYTAVPGPFTILATLQ
jgi:hypothetical protein